MNNRGMVKWAPFNSVINSNSVINKLKQEAKKIKKPILSEEQITIMENIIIESFNDASEVVIHYYKNEYDNVIIGKIIKIDPISKYITINDKKLYFNNIMQIFKKNT